VQLSIRLGQVRTSLDTTWSPLSCLDRLRCSESDRLGRATTSLLLQSSQIQSLDQLLNQSAIGNYFLYSQCIMVINANANRCTHLSCISWEDTTFRGTRHQRQVNGVLGNLVCLYYPSKVTRSDDTSSPATCWIDYALGPDATYGTAQGAVLT
jgi:hypothetical protein